MDFSNKEYFLRAVENGFTYIPLTKSWPADLETPLSTWLKIGNKNQQGVLLESVDGGETLGRWSLVASNPLWTAAANGNQVKRTWRDGTIDVYIGNPFEAIRDFLKPYKSELLKNLPPLGQLFGMWGYELIHSIESSVPIKPSNKKLLIPDGQWMFMDSLLIFDQVKRVITAVAYADLSKNKSPTTAYKKALNDIDSLEKSMKHPLPEVKQLKWESKEYTSNSITSNWSQSDFEKAVNLSKEHITKGDIFQIVLSQKLTTKVAHKPFDIYRSLRMVNPSPYMAFFNFGEWQLIGSSPEVMVKAIPSSEGVLASVRPIAGTRPRGKDNLEDINLQNELLSDPKEKAEHVMLVDLGRNDLGRVCIPGSVQVSKLMLIEKYSHVMHIVSEVDGLLQKEKDIWDLLMATFPAGTVSGAPKIRAMQLINQLEKDPRGPYSGVYGAIDINGAINTAITIRTIVSSLVSDNELEVSVQAGAGIVADSVPQLEYQETLNKARGMLSALASLKD